jgi:hypothetical protein
LLTYFGRACLPAVILITEYDGQSYKLKFEADAFAQSAALYCHTLIKKLYFLVQDFVDVTFAFLLLAVTMKNCAFFKAIWN